MAGSSQQEQTAEEREQRKTAGGSKLSHLMRPERRPGTCYFNFGRIYGKWRRRSVRAREQADMPGCKGTGGG